MSKNIIANNHAFPCYELKPAKPTIPSAYKRTDAGMIPEDWCVSTVGQHIDFEGGSQPDKSFFRTMEKPGYCRLIQIRDYKSDNFMVFIPSNLARRFCSQDDIMIGRYGPPVFQILRGIEGAYNVALIKATPKERLDREFAYYFLSQDTLFHFIDKLSRRTSGQTGVDLKELKAYPLPHPECIDEQRAIATALSDVDALLEELDNLIAKKRNLKQAVMQKLLTGQTRLPGFEGEWESVVLGTVVDLLTGYPFPSEKYQMSGTRLLRGSNIKRGETDWSEELVQYWPEVTHDLQQYMLKEGDIVIAMDGSLVGQSFARVSNDDLPALLLQRVARVRSSKIDMSYLKEWICSDFFTKHCDAHKTVTAIPHISPGDIRCFSIQVPPTIDEQVEIAEILSGMDSEIKAIEKCRKKTVSVKQAMMQELLTGRTRLI